MPERIPDPRMDRALAAWREAHPEGLIGRLIELHRRDPKLARTLAYYIERYHAERTPGGQEWPYWGLANDVAHWPRPESCTVCGGRGMLDDIICWRCHA